MRLSLPDKNEFLRAALKTTDAGMRDWIVGIVDGIDALPEGKSDLPCPPYRMAPAARIAAPNGQAPLIPLAG